MDQSFVGKLGEFSGATVFAIQRVMHSRAQIELGLQIHHMIETKIDTVRLEKRLGVEIVCPKFRTPKVINISAPFQN